MLRPSSNKTRGVQWGLLGAVLGFGVLLGRWSITYSAITASASVCAPCPVASDTGAALSEQIGSADQIAAPATTRVPSGDEWNLLAETSGLSKDRPPLVPAPTGQPDYVVAPFQVLSLSPRVVAFPKFLTEQETAKFIEFAAPRFTASTLALKPGETAESTKNIRTSQGMFVSSSADKSGVLSGVERRIAQVTGIPAANGEAFNVLKYQIGQHYDSHYDRFQKELGYKISPTEGQRVATVLLYLRAPEEGGETIFPLEGTRTVVTDYKSCDQGYKYTPRSGDALLFWSVDPSGEFDRHALHGGCPVVAGEKWVATKWLRDKPTGQTRPSR